MELSLVGLQNAGKTSLVNSISVVDAETSKLLYILTPRCKDNDEALSPDEPPIVKMLIRSNGQWLAAANCYGDIYFFFTWRCKDNTGSYTHWMAHLSPQEAFIPGVTIFSLSLHP